MTPIGKELRKLESFVFGPHSEQAKADEHDVVLAFESALYLLYRNFERKNTDHLLKLLEAVGDGTNLQVEDQLRNLISFLMLDE